jgi:hypothetical protein
MYLTLIFCAALNFAKLLFASDLGAPAAGLV